MTDPRKSLLSPPVTLDTVGDYYFTDAFARNAVKTGITQKDFIRMLLKEYAELQEILIKTLKNNHHSITQLNLQMKSTKLQAYGADFIEIRLIGSRVLTTKLGREIQESKIFGVYWAPVSIAQAVIKAHTFANQAVVFIDYLRQAQEDGYWIASSDEDDEAFLLCSYNSQIKDQHISRIVRRNEENYTDLQEMTRCYIQQQDPYSYLFVADLPEAARFLRLVDRLIDDECLPSLQVRATMTPSTTLEVCIV